MSIQMDFDENIEWKGPFKARVSSDRSTSDMCHAKINNKEAFSPFDVEEKVKVKATYNGQHTTFTDNIKRTDHKKYASIPISNRKELGLTPRDEFSFQVKSLEGGNKPNALVTKSGSVYHKLGADGSPICGHASRDDYRYRGSVPTYEHLIDDHYDLCDACEKRQKFGGMSTEELKLAVIDHYNLDDSEGVLSKKNLSKLLNRALDDQE